MQELERVIIARFEEVRRPEVKTDTDLEWNRAVSKCTELVKDTVKEQGDGWIDAEIEVPANDGYIMVSFANYTLPDIGRYEEDEEGGAFYPGDDDKSYVSYGLIVNAWRPLPKPYSVKE